MSDNISMIGRDCLRVYWFKMKVKNKYDHSSIVDKSQIY
jgi:hypothetical protein